MQVQKLLERARKEANSEFSLCLGGCEGEGSYTWSGVCLISHKQQMRENPLFLHIRLTRRGQGKSLQAGRSSKEKIANVYWRLRISIRLI